MRSWISAGRPDSCDGAEGLARRILLTGLNLFRAARAVLLPPSCRFTPTCSVFAREALERLPLREAIVKILGRLLRCHPFHPGGHDPLCSERLEWTGISSSP